MADHDIMRGSQAWERISNGVPRDITGESLRQELHDIHNVLQPLVDAVNRGLDAQERARGEVDLAFERAVATTDAAKVEAALEHGRIHQRIDRRSEAQEKLRDDLLLPKTGLLPVMEDDLRAYTDKKTGRMTGWLMVVAGGVVTSSLLLVATHFGGISTGGG